MKQLSIEQVSPANRTRVQEHYAKYAPIVEQIERTMMEDPEQSVRSVVSQMGMIDDYFNIYKAMKKYSDVEVDIKKNGKSKASSQAFQEKRVISDDLAESVKTWYTMDRLTLAEISTKLGTTPATVMSFMERHNIARRSKSEVMTERNNMPGRREHLRATSTAAYLNQRKTDTKPEREFKQWLEANGVVYVEQYRKVGNAHPYDFFLPKHNLLVEIDGHYWHSKPEQIVKDKKHVDDAVAKGYDIVRICTKELKEKDGDYTQWITLV